MPKPPLKISDPVHKTIKLSELERKIIQTKTFQRLRNVKQLGLAHYVFPGADFSRFSHSLGVCHVTGRILDELREKLDSPLSRKEAQKYRLAALLHDIGHYPFSHAMEKTIDNFYKNTLLTPKAPDLKSNSEEVSFFTHEQLGKELLEQDPEISQLLKSNEFEPREISSIFRREGGHRFQNLISSDLDADRIDYLMRTACHTGLPFGNVDLDYLITQMQVDKNDKLCLSKKALRAAEHFLLCRHFDRLQVVFHKTVAALELVLKDVIQALLEENIIDCSAEKLKEDMINRKWSSFDDYFILNKIRKLKDSTSQDILKLKVDSILNRNPPRLVGEYEEFRNRHGDDDIKNRIKLVRSLETNLSAQFNIEKERIYLWHETNRSITGMSSLVPASTIEENNFDDRDNYEQLIKILSANGKDSLPITEVKNSLMSILGDSTFNSIRLYILFKEDDIGNRPAIQDFVKKELDFFNQ